MDRFGASGSRVGGGVGEFGPDSQWGACCNLLSNWEMEDGIMRRREEKEEKEDLLFRDEEWSETRLCKGALPTT